MSKFVIIRSDKSGVWFGRALRDAGRAGRPCWVLADARRCWAWEHAAAPGSCTELALSGPGAEATICQAIERVEIVIAEGDERLACSDAARAAFEGP